MRDFDSLIKRKWKNFLWKNSNQKRTDRLGNPINVGISFDEYKELWEPYRHDERMWIDFCKDSLVICRNDDIGDYVIGNVRIDTLSNNSIELGSHENTWSKSEDCRGLLRDNQQFATSQSRLPQHIETRKKTYASIEHQKGGKNSQYGTCWIFNVYLKENKKVPLEELSDWEAIGWSKGRKMKF